MSSAEEQPQHVADAEQQPHQEAVEGIHDEATEHGEHAVAVDDEQQHHEEHQHHDEEHHEQAAPQDDADAQAQQQQQDDSGRGALTEFLATLHTPGMPQISPEQIENFLAAARANGNASDASAQPPASTTEETNLGNVLANLPPHLGQAASALTDLNKQPANSAEHVEEQQQDHVGEAEQDQSAIEAGAREQATGDEEQQHLQAEAGDEQQAEQDQQQQQQDVAELKEEHHHGEHHYEQSDHDASAAALAGLAAAEGGLIGPDGEPVAGSPTPSGRNKKATGPEADRMRKDNHKEVERKRRAHISEGINRLSALIPGYDSKSQNKGAIIMSAADYIQDLKDNEASNIEKWTLEKLLMDQAMGDLQAAVESLRRENERLRAELGLPEAEEGQEQGEPQQQQEHGEGDEGQAHEDAYTHANEEHGGQDAMDVTLQSGESGVAQKAGAGASINDDALKEIAEAAAAASSAAAAAGEEAQAAQDEGHEQHGEGHGDHEVQHEEHGAHEEHHVEEHAGAADVEAASHLHDVDTDTGAGKIRTHDEMEHGDEGVGVGVGVGAGVEVDVEDGVSRSKRSKLA